MACGTPVIGTPIGATPEILRPLDASLIFGEVTPECIAKDLHQFLHQYQQDPQAGEALRQACRHYAESQYNWQVVVDRLEESLRDLTQSNPLRPQQANTCSICTGSKYAPDVIYLGSPYVRCTECGTIRILSLPTPQALRFQYEVEYPDEYRHDQIAPFRAILFTSVLEHLISIIPKGRLLDIGCSGGHLISMAAAQGWQAAGTDLSHKACVLAKQQAAGVVHADAAAIPIHSESMDAITIVNVLDHLSAPFLTLKEAYRILRPAGCVVIRVPNAAFHRPCIRLLSSLGPPIRSRGWDGYPILHLYGFTARTLASVVRQTGFQIVSLRNSPAAINSHGMPQERETISSLRWLFKSVTAVARGVEFISRGRLLFGPSIELYARRPPSDPGSN